MSLEEEVRATLTASVAARRDAFRRRAAALRSATASPSRPVTDSVRTIRRERDDGKAQLFSKDGLTYVVREHSKAGPPTAEVFKDGKLVMKIRLTGIAR